MGQRQIDVRRVRPEEADLLRAVRLRALADAPEAFTARLADEAAQPPSFWEARARRGADGPDGASFLGFCDGAAAGIVGAFRRGGVAELVSMWVAPEARGAGLARALVAAAVAWARASGIASLELWVTSGNADADAFYERLGFRGTEPIPHPGGGMGMKMTLSIAEC
jgi:GNAT superfamily N-acetyltransferase